MKGKSSLKPTGHETVPRFYNRQGLLASFSQEEAVSSLCNRCMNARPPIKGSPLRMCQPLNVSLEAAHAAEARMKSSRFLLEPFFVLSDPQARPNPFPFAFDPAMIVECSGFAPESPEERILSSIRPHFQPIVTSHRHSIYAVEALLRLPDVTTSRDILFRRWEATGEVVDIDMMMVRRVLSAIRTASSPPHTIGVNVSALTVALAPDAYLIEIEALAAEAERVIVEITETFPIPDLAALVYFARKCEELGVFVALDDCTPNHDFCSPVVVQRVRPHILKIDGVLFNNCFNQGTVKPLVEIIKLATSIGAATVAEHIATRDMRDWASGLGVGLLQGYYFGEAAPLSLTVSSDQPRAADCCA